MNTTTSDEDPGKHYRGRELAGIVIDPYRIEELFPNIKRAAARHMLKKLLRYCDKGHSERELTAELQGCLDRWKQMIQEDRRY